MSFKLPDLPYDYTALEPYIDTMTMQVHHTKHHAAYVCKLNDAIRSEGAKLDSPEDIISIQKAGTSIPIAVRNNAGGHYNHSLFWKCMAPVGTSNVRPNQSLQRAIDANFGSVDGMRAKFNEAAVARFGSGWAWLGVVPLTACKYIKMV